MSKNSVVLVDLDDTLLTVNSFKKLIRFIALSGSTRRYRLPLLLVLMQRTTKRINRVEMKKSIQKLAADLFASQPQKLDTFISSLINQSLDKEMLRDIQQGQQLGAWFALTTAALPEYAVPLANLLGADGVVVGSFANEDRWIENFGEQKAARTIDALEQSRKAGLRRIFLSDHADDLPLANECDTTLWVSRGNPLTRSQLLCAGSSLYETGAVTRLCATLQPKF